MAFTFSHYTLQGIYWEETVSSFLHPSYYYILQSMTFSIQNAFQLRLLTRKTSYGLLSENSFQRESQQQMFPLYKQ